MSAEQDVVAAAGTAPNGDSWTLLYRPDGPGGRHDLALHVNGGELGRGSGFDIPDTTEIAFGGGLTPGHGNYYLYGLVTSRILTVRAACGEQGAHTDVATSALPGATAIDGGALRTFVLVRPPVDDVTALVGLDRHGRVAQEIRFPRGLCG